MSQIQQRECLHCKDLFTPDYRNRWHQKFCPEPACRQASKAESQRRWLRKPGSTRHFRDEENVQRVQAWRKAHPGYWKRAAKPVVALQDICISQVIDHQEVSSVVSVLPLQDLVPKPKIPLQDLVPPLPTQDPLLVGLISHLIDSPLQENVAQATQSLILKGRCIWGLSPGMPT